MASLRFDNPLDNYPRRMEQWREQAEFLRAMRDTPAGIPPITTDLSSIEAVLAYYDATEGRLRGATEPRVVTIKVETEDAVRNLIDLAVQAERDAAPERAVLAKVREIHRRLADDPTFDGYTVPFDIETELGEALNPVTSPDGEAI